MFQFISRWLRGEPNIQTRLSADEAIAIARSATSDDLMSRHLALTTVEERDGAVVWIVTSSTVGQMLQVIIDDATGKVLDARHIGLR